MPLSLIDTTEAVTDGWAAPHLFASKISDGVWTPWRHLKHISWAIAQTVATPGGRLLVNLGPGWGKSELMSHYTPTWLLEIKPETRLIIGTATAPLARKNGGKVRNEFKTNPHLTTVLTDDTSAKGEWETTRGGGMVAVGVGQSVIGRRANGFIIDDPYGTWEDSQSGMYRASVEDWYRGTVSNRLEPGGWVIVLHHRMHTKDLSNHLLTSPDAHRWRHISLPSIATEADVLGRKPGESLCPERYSVDELEQKRVEARSTWEPMYQQNPQAGAVGRIYPAFGEANIDYGLSLRPNLPVDIAIDWNLNPGMHIEVGQHDQMTDTFSVVHEIHGSHMSLNASAAAFIKLWRTFPGAPKVRIFGDATGASIESGDGFGLIFKKHLLAANISIMDKIPSRNPGVIDRVCTLNEAVCDSITGVRRVKVHPRCARLINDFNEVVADEEGEPDKAEKELTHASDACGYWVHYLSPIRLHAKRTSRGRIGGGSSRG